MKQTTKMSRAVCQLERIYSNLNQDFFEGQLPTPIITVQSKPGTCGHFTPAKVWRRTDDDSTYELNIAAEVLDREIEETLDTMLHEMVHLYCRENDIQDTSRNGRYHNGRFKIEAEKRGLECYQCGSAGWNTRPTDKLVEYALEKGWNEIKIGRSTLPPLPQIGATGTSQPGTTVTGGKRPSSTRKLVCPNCGQSVRATKKVNIICGDCMVKMEEV